LTFGIVPLTFSQYKPLKQLFQYSSILLLNSQLNIAPDNDVIHLHAKGIGQDDQVVNRGGCQSVTWILLFILPLHYKEDSNWMENS